MSDHAEKEPETPPAADPRAHGYVLDEQIGYLLRKAYQRNAVLFGEKVQCGLTPTQFAVMARLTELGSVSQNQLGRTVGLDVATTKGVVDRLHARGLIETARDPNDRRRQMISLSEAGWHLFEENALIGIEVSNETLAPLTQSERRSLLKILKKIQ
ncbi:DNA-binding MarR family transcriptional regulator [Breoghania corrubedonensis]|uniref:DNA-binding MarR family transcriptional regulator n=1 Tax=Breoghania corrubedonensis TaxID=665038 RepID=A0A2T5V5N1_9HYPH|nr:MarR family winged helix-turn-helix transcriptional regulator [Breoghania corrubedonensis]PTW59026.1 DNA-binding MarR family transcriptional regulator [Breoghania corrubedonensis]